VSPGGPHAVSEVEGRTGGKAYFYVHAALFFQNFTRLMAKTATLALSFELEAPKPNLSPLLTDLVELRRNNWSTSTTFSSQYNSLFTSKIMLLRSVVSSEMRMADTFPLFGT
jgi:hypothetical protein